MAIPLRGDFDATSVGIAARGAKNAGQARRLLALAAIYDGSSRTEAATIGGVTLQIVRDWVLKFNAQGPTGLIDRKPPGQPARLNAERRAALASMIESGPIPGGSWGGAVAADRPVPMALGHIPGAGGPANAEPRTSYHGLSQAVGPSAPSRAGRRRDRAF